jgi:hypothetical protein
LICVEEWLGLGEERLELDCGGKRRSAVSRPYKLDVGVGYIEDGSKERARDAIMWYPACICIQV